MCQLLYASSQDALIFCQLQSSIISILKREGNPRMNYTTSSMENKSLKVAIKKGLFYPIFECAKEWFKNKPFC